MKRTCVTGWIRSKHWVLALFALVTCATIPVTAGEERPGSTIAAAYSFAVTVSDGAGGSQTLLIGVDPSATDGIDADLGEVEQPPRPPAGVFDARLIGDDVFVDGLGEGVLVDYRQGGASFSGFCEHELQYQVGKGTTITIAWDLPAWAIGHLRDLVSGSIVDVTMNGTGSYVVTSPELLSKLALTVGYDIPVPVQLSEFTCSLTGARTVTLRWKTLSEVNNYGFTVQRRLHEAELYEDIPGGFIAGRGTTLEPQSYLFTDTTVQNPGTYAYRLKQVDLDGTVHYTDAVFAVVSATGVPETLPGTFELAQNYPNPFNPASTLIRFTVGGNAPVAVRIVVFDLLGREVAVLVDQSIMPGDHWIRFDGRGLSSGWYTYRMEAGDFVQSKRMLLLR
ncbi:MAG: T9SS type A sorting domain-containing protein [Bacteroidetes bacterium]|nr:T9SS type A sorting domain-containing protein [Bacteroidota bacterium]